MQNGRLSIDNTSTINVDGVSRWATGTSPNESKDSAGASFIGQGGYCGTDKRVIHFWHTEYGKFDMKVKDLNDLNSYYYDKTLIGSFF